MCVRSFAPIHVFLCSVWHHKYKNRHLSAHRGPGWLGGASVTGITFVSSVMHGWLAVLAGVLAAQWHSWGEGQFLVER